VNYTPEDWIILATATITAALLIAALFYKGAARVFPWFTARCVNQLVRTAVLFTVHAKGSYRIYFWVYWYAQLPDLLLLLGVIWNMAVVLFRRQMGWAPGAKLVAGLGTGLAFATALVLAGFDHPNTSSALIAWCMQTSLFTSLLITEVATAITLTADLVSGQRNRWVSGLSIGLILWFGVSCAVEGIQAYFGDVRYYQTLSHIEKYAEIVALVVWLVTFSQTEVDTPELSQDQIDTLLELHNRL